MWDLDRGAWSTRGEEGTDRVLIAQCEVDVGFGGRRASGRSEVLSRILLRAGGWWEGKESETILSESTFLLEFVSRV